MTNFSLTSIPDSFLKKWQEIADLIAGIINIPAALIMRTENEMMEIFISSQSAENPYNPGDKDHWHGLYCETVIKSQKKLQVQNALKDKNWDKNPDIKLGMIAYLGLPVNFPDQQPFGTICVLDNKERVFSHEEEKLLCHFKKALELDLALMESLPKEESTDIIQKLIKSAEKHRAINQEYLATIQELKEANEELIKTRRISEESDEKMRSIYRVAPTGIGIVIDRQIKQINPCICEMTGYGMEELIDKDTRILYPTQLDYDFVGEEKYSQIRTTGTGEVETRWQRKDGSIINVLLASTPIDINDYSKGITFTALDITQRKRTEKALRKSEAIKNKMVSNIGDVIVIIDENGINQYKSPNLTGLFGWSQEDLLGKSSWDHIHPEDLAAGKQFLQNLSKEPNAKGTTEVRFMRKDGKYVWIEITLVNLIHDTDINGFLGNYHDVSERKKAEQLLKEKNEELQAANNELLAAKEKAEESDRLKSSFLANMSHEIRTPMNGILGFVDILKQPELVGNQQQDYLTLIEKSGNRMLNIINDIIDISKIEAGLNTVNIKESNIGELIEYTYTFFKPEVESKGMMFSINKHLPKDDEIIQTDGDKVYAILTNFVKNAIKYSHKGTIELGCAKSGETLELYVKDSGVGIPKERHNTIFERFFQGGDNHKVDQQGAGLGLSISKAYVEMLGGEIWVESEEGKGSAFYFTLPCKGYY